jgi:hypothetical protein
MSDTTTSSRMERLRGSFALIETRIRRAPRVDIAGNLRVAIEALRSGLQRALGLPNSNDISELLDRVDALDRKLNAIETARTNAEAEAEAETETNTESRSRSRSRSADAADA